jgi:hypothetical protein
MTPLLPLSAFKISGMPYFDRSQNSGAKQGGQAFSAWVRQIVPVRGSYQNGCRPDEAENPRDFFILLTLFFAPFATLRQSYCF